MNTQDDIRMHADAITYLLNQSAQARNEADEYDRLARRHLARLKALKTPEPVRCEDALRAGLADSYVNCTFGGQPAALVKWSQV